MSKKLSLEQAVSMLRITHLMKDSHAKGNAAIRESCKKLAKRMSKSDRTMLSAISKHPNPIQLLEKGWEEYEAQLKTA
jgi:hypothetical protein